MSPSTSLPYRRLILCRSKQLALFAGLPLAQGRSVQSSPARLRTLRHAALQRRAGIVETGLFLGLADVAILAFAEGIEVRERRS